MVPKIFLLFHSREWTKSDHPNMTAFHSILSSSGRNKKVLSPLGGLQGCGRGKLRRYFPEELLGLCTVTKVICKDSQHKGAKEEKSPPQPKIHVTFDSALLAP